jgi:hypothetical protein
MQVQLLRERGQRSKLDESLILDEAHDCQRVHLPAYIVLPDAKLSETEQAMPDSLDAIGKISV